MYILVKQQQDTKKWSLKSHNTQIKLRFCALAWAKGAVGIIRNEINFKDGPLHYERFPIIIKIETNIIISRSKIEILVLI